MSSLFLLLLLLLRDEDRLFTRGVLFGSGDVPGDKGSWFGSHHIAQFSESNKNMLFGRSEFFFGRLRL